MIDALFSSPESRVETDDIMAAIMEPVPTEVRVNKRAKPPVETSPIETPPVGTPPSVAGYPKPNYAEFPSLPDATQDAHYRFLIEHVNKGGGHRIPNLQTRILFYAGRSNGDASFIPNFTKYVTHILTTGTPDLRVRRGFENTFINLK